MEVHRQPDGGVHLVWQDKLLQDIYIFPMAPEIAKAIADDLVKAQIVVPEAVVPVIGMPSGNGERKGRGQPPRR